tara:strand:+ start:2856 stop:3581 length:726 start_codon:yes stop_codon:yes gene_type:complete
MISKLLLISLAYTSAFFNPHAKLSSGKTATLMGNGPPVLFSTGLYGTMPRFFYNEFVSDLKKNFTIVTIEGLDPIKPQDIDDVADAIKTDTLAYISHSSFEPEILESKRINTAIMLDPISIPKVSFNGVEQHSVSFDYPALVIKAGKLYDAKAPLPEWQNIEMNGDVKYETYEDVGHPDILDDNWANIAKQIGLWEMVEGEMMSFKDWKLNGKNSIPQIRKQYRKDTSRRISEFIQENLAQ